MTAVDAEAFFRMLDALLPRPTQPPWSLLDAAPQVHPVIFVHRVQGLESGLYCLARDPSALAALKTALRSEWLWAPVPGCPPQLPLRLLAPMDVRAFAAGVSCQQDIAGDSAFSLGMLARFDDVTAERPWLYRQRFWEAGLLGQVLYLEAEAAGVQGTGIGCYFDDAVHEAIAAIIVDKNFAAVSAIADRNVVLVKGKIVFEGSGNELTAQPELMQQYLGI